MSGRGTANLLTRATAILATVFMVLSLTLALLNRGTTGVGRLLAGEPARLCRRANRPGARAAARRPEGPQRPEQLTRN